MRLSIAHDTTYAYSDAVFLEPHTVRLRPHSGARQRLCAFSLAVDPEPTGRSEWNDTGGVWTTLWFEGTYRNLTLHTRSEVELFDLNPYAFLISHDHAMRLPVRYPSTLRRPLEPFLRRSRATKTVSEFSQAIANESNGDTTQFVSLLAQTIYNNFACVVRERGRTWPASKTLRLGQGACRDLAVLYMDACRAQGIAARFVSGYVAETDQAQPHLHAWPEVYLPGAGWRGFDPTNGLAVAGNHVSVAWAESPENASPVSGSFRGTGVRCSMSYRISITRID